MALQQVLLRQSYELVTQGIRYAVCRKTIFVLSATNLGSIFYVQHQS